MKHTEALIVGASISGLAVAASLQKHSIDYIIIEKESQVAAPWRNHYDRLHLHTNKRISSLPYLKFDASIPRYASRQQVVDYLEKYQATFQIHPLFHTEATWIAREDNYWITKTNQETFVSKYVVIATGAFGRQRQVSFTGMETFTGKLLHSSDYKTGEVFTGQKVLVVGFGNSACEIAIDLYEQGALPSMSVRSPVNIIPRDLLGIPILELSILLSHLPPRVADAVSSPLMRLSLGDITKLGLKKLPYGPLEEIKKEKKIPVLDIGTLKHIREKHIAVYGNIDHIEGNTVCFSDGKSKKFDAIVAAIGYDRSCDEILDIDKNRFEDLQFCVDQQQYFGKDDLYFCGFYIGSTGHIREIASDAQKIATNIAGKRRLKNDNNQ